MSELFDEGYAYNSLNIARCALSTILKPEDNYTFGANPTTCRVLKGMYNTRPPTARYTQTWDTDIVLKFLCELSPLRDISLKQLTLKFTVLFLLVNCQRIQTVSALDVGKVFLEEDKVVFGIADVLKHSKAGRSLGLISCKKFDEDPRVCIWRVTKEYIRRTEELRPKNTKGEPKGQLVISHVPPYKPASKNTIARWTREVLAMSGVQVQCYKAHSIRGASASKLAVLNVPVEEIMKKAFWKKESTFRRFYDKPIKIDTDVTHVLLSEFVKRTK